MAQKLHLLIGTKKGAFLLDALDARWPGMRDRLCDSTPAIRRHLNVFVDGRRARLDTPLPPARRSSS